MLNAFINDLYSLNSGQHQNKCIQMPHLSRLYFNELLLLITSPSDFPVRFSDVYEHPKVPCISLRRRFNSFFQLIPACLTALSSSCGKPAAHTELHPRYTAQSLSRRYGEKWGRELIQQACQKEATSFQGSKLTRIAQEVMAQSFFNTSLCRSCQKAELETSSLSEGVCVFHFDPL